MCTTKCTPYGTTVTIVKWGFFQIGRTANGATDDTTDGATDGATDGTQTIISKELYNKNGKREARERVELLSSDGQVIE